MPRSTLGGPAIDEKQTVDFCRKHAIRKLALFGPILRDDFRPSSDVDVLVAFEPSARIGFLEIAAMEAELGKLFGRKVDLRAPADLSRYFRQELLDSAEVLYEQRSSLECGYRQSTFARQTP